mmetsp:Transcript_13458/g.22111  ORF Transcript_13458/g.22111 Transcript_13458/m.22111 type:complete len:846 (+) Transcript_13458:178-2715(+)
MQQAIQNGKDAVMKLLDGGHDVNTINGSDWPPICFATYYGKPDVIQLLLDRGADANKALGMGATSIFIACEHQKLECLKVLIEKGKADPNLACHGSECHPFLKCCENGNLGIVRYMVEGANCNMDQQQLDGATGFFMACQHNRLEVVKYLCEKGVDADLGKRDSATPIIVASELGNAEVVRAICTLARSKKSADTAMYNGVTPLYKACEHGHFEIVKILIEDAQVDCDKPKADGVSPLFTACQMGHLNIIQYLADKGADINKAKNDGVVPIYMAAEYRNLPIVDFLISKGADLTRGSINGLTPLHAACIQHEHRTVESLVAAGAPMEARDRGGFSPLSNAAEWGRDGVMRVLLAKGADVTAAGWNGNNPLHVASWKGRPGSVSQLLAAGAPVNGRNHYGFTPLALAALGRQHAVMQALLQAGADPNIQDNDGNTPLHHAIDGGDPNCCRLLYNQPNLQLGLRNLLGFNPVMHAMSRHPDRVRETVGDQYKKYVDALPDVIPAKKFTDVACQVLPLVDLANVLLLERAHILEAGEFPHYDLCQQRGWHSDAREISLADRVLFISHRWGSVDHPDPTGEQYRVLKAFMDSAQGSAFKYVWLDYACICQDRGSQDFMRHLGNIPTAVWSSTDCLVIPKLVPSPYNNDPGKVVPTSHLVDYLDRAWCILEAMACLLTGTRVYCSFQVGDAITIEAFDRPEGAASMLGFFMSYVKVWNKMFAEKQKDMMNVNLNVLETQWRAIEPCQILGLLIRISQSEDPQTREILEKSLDMSLSLEDFQACSVPDLQELWGLMGNCAYEEDKIVVMKLMLFIGYYSINLLDRSGVEKMEGAAGEIYDLSSESKICSVM